MIEENMPEENILEESINMVEYVKKIQKIVDLTQILNNPRLVRNIIKFSCDKDGDIKSAEIKQRIYLQKPWNEESICFVDCDEQLLYDKELENFRHHYFKFHFQRKDENNEYRMFRTDFVPTQQPPLHAHNDMYKKTNEDHLEYKKDIDLDLNVIDFCTILNILDRYLNNSTKYPLDNTYATEYNQIIEPLRRMYDEKK